ncbi:hypothetical protein WJX82_003727 [Trebouxia sp. C0006]
MVTQSLSYKPKGVSASLKCSSHPLYGRHLVKSDETDAECQWHGTTLAESSFSDLRPVKQEKGAPGVQSLSSLTR